MNRQASDSRDRETHQTLSAELPGPRVSLRGKVGNRLLPVYGRTVTPNDSHFSIAEVPRSRVQVAVAAAGAYARRQGAKYNESVPGCGAAGSRPARGIGVAALLGKLCDCAGHVDNAWRGRRSGRIPPELLMADQLALADGATTTVDHPEKVL
jgi:hypothetical protein